MEGHRLHRWVRYGIIRHHLPSTNADQHWSIVNIEMPNNQLFNSNHLYRCFVLAPLYPTVVCLALSFTYIGSFQDECQPHWLELRGGTTTTQVPKREFFYYGNICLERLKDVDKLKMIKKKGKKDKTLSTGAFFSESIFIWISNGIFSSLLLVCEFFLSK